MLIEMGMAKYHCSADKEKKSGPFSRVIRLGQ
jgi:hypothetical protein